MKKRLCPKCWDPLPKFKQFCLACAKKSRANIYKRNHKKHAAYVNKLACEYYWRHKKEILEYKRQFYKHKKLLIATTCQINK